MKTAPFPSDEQLRLEKLYRYDILDTASEKEYDDIVRLASSICETPLADISFIDKDRQWFKTRVGFDATETSRDIAFCAHAILIDEIMVVPNTLEDERFFDNPLVQNEPHIRFYAGMPLRTPDGFRLGTLCAMDTVPRTLTEEQKDSLRVLANHVIDLLELRARNRMIAEQNRRLETLSDLKSRLISIMAHDLRSPMANIASIVRMFREFELSSLDKEQLLSDLGQVLDSTRYMLDNVIGWASRQLETSEFEITPIELAELASELTGTMTHEVEKKNNRLRLEIKTDTGIRSDRNILVFILRNILVNANKYTRDGVITFGSYDFTGPDGTAMVSITISDTGVGMSPEQKEKLFDWHSREKSIGTDGETGSGLALLFCHDFVQRLGGEIAVESDLGAGTIVTVRLPRVFSR